MTIPGLCIAAVRRVWYCRLPCAWSSWVPRGPIGRQTLDLVSRYPERLEVAGLSCHGRVEDLAAIVEELHRLFPDLPGPLLTVTDPAAHARAARDPRLKDRLLGAGPAGLRDLVASCEDAHCLVNGLVGAVGAGAHPDRRRAGNAHRPGQQGVAGGGRRPGAAGGAAGRRRSSARGFGTFRHGPVFEWKVCVRGGSADPDRLGWSFPGDPGGRAGHRHPGAGPRPSHLETWGPRSPSTRPP